MDKGSQVLVTGGAGFVGSHLVRALLQAGYHVRVLDNLSTGHSANISEVESDVDFRLGDIRDSADCESAVDGIHCIYHLAALASVSRSMADPVATHAVNVNGTLNLLEAAREAGVRRMVFSSSSSIYGDTESLPKHEENEPLPRSPYAASKLASEQYVLAYARAGLIEGVALRYFNVFGPRQDPNGPYAAVIPRLMSSALTGSAMRIYGDGSQTRDFTYVDNVVHANLLASSLPAERCSGWAINVGGGTRSSLLEIIEILQAETGSDFPVIHDPSRAGDVRHSLASLIRAEHILGYEPQVDVRDGLRRTWDWTTRRGQDDVLSAVAR
jgi:UDP-glucose 4-epimerase